MSENNRKILILSAWLPGGGVETLISNFSRIFSSKGYQIKIVSLSSYLEWNWFENQSFEIVFHSLFKKEEDLNVFFTLKEYSNILNIARQEIKNFSPSNIFVTHTFLGSVIYKLNKEFEVGFIFWPMNLLLITPQKSKIKSTIYTLFKKCYLKILVSQFKATICISSKIQEQLPFSSRESSYLSFVPINTIVTSFINEKPLSPHYIFVGRIDKRKNLNFLLKSLSELKTKWKLDIVGEGPDKLAAIELSKKLGISDNLNWIGLRFPPFGDKLNYTALFMTSISEGFPIVVIDALLFGIPVVCSTHLSIYKDAIVEGFNGIGYQRDSNASLSKAISTLNVDKNSFNSHEISENCISRFGDEQYFNRLSFFLKEINKK